MDERLKPIYSRKPAADDALKTWHYQIQVGGGCANGLIRSSDANVAADLANMTTVNLGEPKFMHFADGSISGVRYSAIDGSGVELFSVLVQT